ncbi:MAG: DUF2029 domain-containing protein [Anaerolineales bacterium]|nr:DUF2029 domain-containing protein [Anaerolineales bacterium]
MNNQRASLLLAGIILLSVIALAGLSWANYRYAAQNPGMNAFLPAWSAMRWFMIKGWSPYSQETRAEMEQFAYGRPANPGEQPGLFTYPLYSILIFGPFALIEDFPLARALWMTLLELALVGIAALGISLARWQPSRWMTVVLVIFAVFWYYSARAVINGNPIVLSTFLMMLGFLAMQKEQDVLAGFLIVLAGIKLEAMFILILYVLIWAFSQRRWTLIWSVVASFGFMIAITSFLISDWTIENLRIIVEYHKSTFGLTPGSLLAYWLPGIGRQLGWGLTILIAATLIWEWWSSLGKDFRWFIWTAYLTLVSLNLVGLRTALENYVLMVPAFILMLAIWDERWGKLGRGLMILGIFGLFFGVWMSSLNSARQGVSPDLNTTLMLTTPLFMLFGLYWVRMWATRPPRMPLEMFGKQLG